ncbi:PEP-CTERM sorting domain-containing protein [Crateriforma spongiae]|uniref:PEP-CTERM sorting domain-containing protein n=1 Tax=Crateriforma spongiae TaxID=2724528 RepID=UPI0014463C9D|nr:PEP-CTERM sorting domain-containing protein [Crateriforma spongiae]
MKKLLFIVLCCITAKMQAAIVINEFDSDTSGVDALEFVELFGDPNMSLDGLSIVGVNGSDDLTYDSFAFDLDGFSTNSDGLFLIGNAAVAGADIVFSGNGLQNGPDAIVLFTGNISDYPNDTAPPTGAMLVDVVHYGTNDSADPGLSALYPSASYIDEGDLGDKDTDSIGRSVDGAGSFVVFDTPTPGALNAAAVPEPSSVACLTLLGCGAVYRRVRRKKVA